MKKITLIFPELKDEKDKVEVRKALIDLMRQLNEILAEIETRLSALEP